MRFVLQTANVVSDAKNCLYPNKVEVGSAEELQQAVRFDHVCTEYQKNYRSAEKKCKIQQIDETENSNKVKADSLMSRLNLMKNWR